LSRSDYQARLRGVSRRGPGASAGSWPYGVIDHHRRDILRAKRTKKMRQVSLDAVLTPVGPLTDEFANVSDELFEAARVAQEGRERLVDAGLDLDGALAACDPPTAVLVQTYANDGSVEAVARELHLSYATAWRKMKKARVKVRQLLAGYGADDGRRA
jgi:DNA-directed RNA polymerase specialized sigma24 family protein